MTGKEKVSIARGNHLMTAWQSARLFSMVLAALVATIGLRTALSPTAAALLETDPIIEQQTEAASPRFSPGIPTSTTPSDVKPADAILNWTPTGQDLRQDTYDVRVAVSADVSEAGDLTAATEQNNLIEPRHDITTSPEGVYYWQVRSCGQPLSCTAWSQVWKLTIDGTAPLAPTGELMSDGYSQTVSIAGTSEAGSRVTVTTGAQTCITNSQPDGSWSCQFTDEFDYGDYTALIRATDAAGNESIEAAVDFAVKELFVAPQITAEELPAVLDIVPVDETPENNVLKQPVISAIDVDTSSSEAIQVSAGPAALSVEGGVVQSSESGWQVFGLPWFIWLGSVASITGGWWMFGPPVPRRLGSLLSL